MLRGLPISWRKTAGSWTKGWQALTNPFTAWTIHAVAIWMWHAPELFQSALSSDLAHTAQHLSFFLSALLFWWSLFHTHGSSVLYLFTTAIHTSILGALLTFAPAVWYPAYAATAPHWGLTPLEDQQIGGLIMWIPAGLVYVGAGLAFFAAWLGESERRRLQWRIDLP